MKINLEKLVFKNLERTDFNTLIQWASDEGWNPGKNDAEVFWETDPDGFYGVYDHDKLIGGGAIISYNGEFGFMGLFIVHPTYRSNGIGKKLWYFRRDLLIKRLQPEAAIGMDGVLAMQSFYQKGGFNIAYKDIRYEFNSIITPASEHISIITNDDFENIQEFDALYFGCRRSVFLKKWLFMPEGKSFMYSENNQVLGYAVVRKAEIGYKIGPLYANNQKIAEELFKSCLNIKPDVIVFLDIPCINENAVNLVKKYGGKYVFECARMYYGQGPNVEINNIYGISTFELG